MIYVALDLSIHSTGVCIADTYARTCTFVQLTDLAYKRIAVKKHRFNSAMVNSIGIADALSKLLMPYRFEQIYIGIESVGFGFLRSRTNSTTDLLFEGAIVASSLVRLFGADVLFIEPTKHKKAFTGNGKATKAMSIGMLLHWFPQLRYASSKLDDMADAMSIMTVMLPDIRTYEPKVYTK